MKEKIQEYVDHTLTFVREYFVEGDYVDCLDTLPGANSMYIPMRKLPTDRIMYQWYLKWCKETNTEPLPRNEALGRINEAFTVKCPQMRIIRATEISTGRERDTYVMPEFADKLESISIYDEDSRNEILDIFAEGLTAEKITPPAVSTPTKREPSPAGSSSSVTGSAESTGGNEKDYPASGQGHSELASRKKNE